MYFINSPFAVSLCEGFKQFLKEQKFVDCPIDFCIFNRIWNVLWCIYDRRPSWVLEYKLEAISNFYPVPFIVASLEYMLKTFDSSYNEYRFILIRFIRSISDSEGESMRL